MEKTSKIFTKKILVLPIITFVCTLLVSGFYVIFDKQVQETKKLQDLKIKKTFFPEAVSFEDINPDLTLVKNSESRIIGYVLYTIDYGGYSGKVKVMVALNLDWTIKDFVMVAHEETPGLGTIANENSFKNNFKNKYFLSDCPKTKNELKTEFGIEAISGATYTTMAVSRAIFAASTKYFYWWLDQVDNYQIFEGLDKTIDAYLFEIVMLKEIFLSKNMLEMAKKYSIYKSFKKEEKPTRYVLSNFNLKNKEKNQLTKFLIAVKDEYVKNPRKYFRR